MQIISDLITIFINEKNTNELLPFQNEIIEKTKKILIYQKKYIKSIKNEYKIIYEQDFERVTYFLQEYLKKRLEKLKQNFGLNQNKMSKEEKNFYSAYLNLTRKYNFYAESEECESNEYVGFIVLCESKNIIMDGNEILMREGDVFVCALKDVHSLLLNNEIMLF